MRVNKIIPLVNRGSSNSSYVNFLYSYLDLNIYISDNHRIALWCWINFLKACNYGKYSLIRIDKHFDFRNVKKEALDKFKNNLKDLKDLNRFLDCSHPSGKNIKLVLWDNYVYYDYNIKLFKEIIFFSIQDKKYLELNDGKDEFDVYYKEDVEKLKDLLSKNKKIILDIDLDFFIDEDFSGDMVLKNISEKRARTYFELLYQFRNNIKLLTLALSPECCGGWDNSEKILKIFSEIFQVEIEL